MTLAPPAPAPIEAPPRAARPPATGYDVAAWILAGLGLVAILRLHLLPALLGGLAVHETVHAIAPRLTARGSTRHMGRVIAVALLALAVVAGLIGLTLAIVAFFRSDQGNLSALVSSMADVIETSRDYLPAWLVDRLPENADELKRETSAWLRAHAGDLTSLGAGAGRSLVLALIGMIVGGLVALSQSRPSGRSAPLARALGERMLRLAGAFRRIVFAQVRISALNTLLTATYLAVLLPLAGIQLPLVKTMIAVTFIAGLLPVIGNLISNTVIVTISLSHSFGAAVASLAYLVIIHKLEYFVNARIVGGEIRAGAWEILVAMLVMESAFGIPGVVAAPIYYAYVKNELAARGLV
jgi:predicted PurR-regulated permease PerM